MGTVESALEKHLKKYFLKSARFSEVFTLKKSIHTEHIFLDIYGHASILTSKFLEKLFKNQRHNTEISEQDHTKNQYDKISTLLGQ